MCLLPGRCPFSFLHISGVVVQEIVGRRGEDGGDGDGFWLHWVSSIIRLSDV